MLQSIKIRTTWTYADFLRNLLRYRFDAEMKPFTLTLTQISAKTRTVFIPYVSVPYKFSLDSIEVSARYISLISLAQLGMKLYDACRLLNQCAFPHSSVPLRLRNGCFIELSIVLCLPLQINCLTFDGTNEASLVSA